MPSVSDLDEVNNEKRKIMKKRRNAILREDSILLKRWTLDLANALIDEGYRNTKAFTMAHKARMILGLLGLGVVTFEYEKKDGTMRHARGTLCKGICREYDDYVVKGQKKTEPKLGLFSYWDLDANGFRSFDIRKNITIIQTVIKSNE